MNPVSEVSFCAMAQADRAPRSRAVVRARSRGAVQAGRSRSISNVTRGRPIEAYALLFGAKHGFAMGRHLVSFFLISPVVLACGSGDASTDAATCTEMPPLICDGCCGAKYAADQCQNGEWFCRPLGVACIRCDAGFAEAATDAPPGDTTGVDTSDGDVTVDDAGAIVYGDAGICATCGPASVCVEDQTIGGPDAGPPDDGGNCPTGYVPSENRNACVRPPSFHCAALPATCYPPGGAAPAHCACAPSLCPISSPNGQCTDLSPSLMQCLIRLA
jgi:hypothetical protein